MMVNRIFRLYSRPTLLLIAATIVTVQAFWTAFDMISIENSKAGIITSDLKVTRYNKTAYGVSGTIELTADLNDDYDCEMKAFLSAQGNSKFTLLPYKVPRDKCCTHMESTYWRGIESSLQDCSNIPRRKGNEIFCLSAKKGQYEVRNFAFNYFVVPRHMDSGTYKIEVLLYKTGSPEVSSIASFVAKLY